jgi:hypothetical protein
MHEMKGSTIKGRIVAVADPTDRRRAARVPVDLEARVRELGSEGSEAKLLNISDTGFMAESSGSFEVGSRVWLILPGRDRASAVIRWTAGHRLGAEFAEPVTLAGIDPPRGDGNN